MSNELESFCSDFCMCIALTLPSSKRKQFEEELTKKEYRVQYESELEKTNLGITGRISLGIPRSEEKERGFIVNLTPDNALSDRDFFKVFPIFQKRVEALQQKFDLKKFGGMTCTDFSFLSRRFKPLGELTLPANLTLRNDLVERLGEPELQGFKIGFKESPIGMDAAFIQLSDGKLRVRIRTAYEFNQIKNIIKSTFIHAKQLANLFVEEVRK